MILPNCGDIHPARLSSTITASKSSQSIHFMIPIDQERRDKSWIVGFAAEGRDWGNGVRIHVPDETFWQFPECSIQISSDTSIDYLYEIRRKMGTVQEIIPLADAEWDSVQNPLVAVSIHSERVLEATFLFCSWLYVRDNNEYSDRNSEAFGEAWFSVFFQRHFSRLSTNQLRLGWQRPDKSSMLMQIDWCHGLVSRIETCPPLWNLSTEVNFFW
jgi:hypothetical protein